MTLIQIAAHQRTNIVHGTEQAIPADSPRAAIAASGLAQGMDESERAALEQIAGYRLVHTGKTLYRAGDIPTHVYIVARGCIKTTASLPDGRERVNGLNVPGAIVGLDALGGSASIVDASASSDSAVSQLACSSFASLARDIPKLQHNLHRAMSRAILSHHRMMWLLSFACARERVGLLLSSLAENAESNGSIHIPATRNDVASLLNIRPETYSRELARLCAAGVVRFSRRAHHIEFIDRRRLAEVCPVAFPDYPMFYGKPHTERSAGLAVHAPAKARERSPYTAGTAT